MKATSLARTGGAVALSAIAAVHIAWASGSSWPAKNRVELAQAVIGADTLPGAGPATTVAALLAFSALLVSGRPVRGSRFQRTGAAVVAGVLALRALAGFGGIMPHERRSATFRRWNRRLYSPLCLALALLSAAGTAPAEML